VVFIVVFKVVKELVRLYLENSLASCCRSTYLVLGIFLTVGLGVVLRLALWFQN